MTGQNERTRVRHERTVELRSDGSRFHSETHEIEHAPGWRRIDQENAQELLLTLQANTSGQLAALDRRDDLERQEALDDEQAAEATVATWEAEVDVLQPFADTRGELVTLIGNALRAKGTPPSVELAAQILHAEGVCEGESIGPNGGEWAQLVEACQAVVDHDAEKKGGSA